MKGTQHLDCSKADFQLLGGEHELSRAVCADGCVLGAEFASGVQGSQLAACRELCTPKAGFVCAEAAGCMLRCCCSLREAVPAGFCSDWRKVSCAGGRLLVLPRAWRRCFAQHPCAHSRSLLTCTCGWGALPAVGEQADCRVIRPGLKFPLNSIWAHVKAAVQLFASHANTSQQPDGPKPITIIPTAWSGQPTPRAEEVRHPAGSSQGMSQLSVGARGSSHVDQPSAWVLAGSQLRFAAACTGSAQLAAAGCDEAALGPREEDVLLTSMWPSPESAGALSLIAILIGSLQGWGAYPR